MKLDCSKCARKGCNVRDRPRGMVVRILRKRRERKMCDLGMQDLINRVNGCSEEEKLIILEQFDIKELLAAVDRKVEVLTSVVENGKILFGVLGG